MNTVRLVGYREAARMLAVPVGTLRSMVCRRQIPHVRISARVVVFDLAAIDTWLNARRIPALDAVPSAA
jgi:excisionase family DNA binding protein